MKLPIVVCAASLIGVAVAEAEDWPQWLGVKRDGVWRESGILKTFPTDGPRLRWKTSIGSGYSGPAVADDFVYLMDRIDTLADPKSAELLHEGSAPTNPNFLRQLLPGKERVLCLREADGRIVWQYEYDCPYTTVTTYAIGPRVTPTVDGDRVYTLGAEGNLFCFKTKDGSVVWSKDFKKEYQLEIPEWGIAAHPLVDGDLLICLVGGEGTTCVAFDKMTGEERWRSLSANQPGYCAPMIYSIGGKRQLIIWDSDAVNGLDPRTGDVYWSEPFQATFAMSIGIPRLEGDSLFLMSFNRQSARIRLADDGLSASTVWRGDTKIGIGGVFNTAVIRDGHVYACGQGGRYSCIRLDSGERVWSTFEPSTGKRPAAWANVFTIPHQDRYFHANDLGDLIIAEMDPAGYHEISRTHLIEPTHNIGSRKVVWSHPAFANQSVYWRNDQEIICTSLAQ
ncbi:MAG: PQQ-binding-like beta-propeller repeat protein [Planctomycetaceae bacterium]|nr:PQQ-binding-like beta-propeller repeat protein [Planctomycetaceae bacterium]